MGLLKKTGLLYGTCTVENETDTSFEFCNSSGMGLLACIRKTYYAVWDVRNGDENVGNYAADQQVHKLERFELLSRPASL